MNVAPRSLFLLATILATVRGGHCALTTQDPDRFEPAPRTLRAVPADAGKLVPADAPVVVRISSPQELIDNVKALAAMARPGLENTVSIAPLLLPSGLRARDLDLRATSVIAVTETPRGPMPIFVVAAADNQEAAAITDMPATTSGDYLGLGIASAPVAGTETPAVATDLLSGDVSIRADIQRTIAPLRPRIERLLDPEFVAARDPHVDANAMRMLEQIGGEFRDLLDIAEQLDLAVSLDGGDLVVDAVLTTQPTEPIQRAAGKYAPMDLARRLPVSDGAMMVVSDADWSALVARLSGFYAAMADGMEEAQRDAFMQMIAKSEDLYAALGGGAFSLEFGKQGFSGVGIFECQDPAAFTTAYFEFIDAHARSVESLGVSYSERTNATVGGVEFSGMGMKFDLAAMLRAQGQEMPPRMAEQMEKAVESMLGDEMRFSIGASGDLLLMTFGDADAEALVAAAQTRGSAKPSLDAAMAELHSSPTVFMSLDMRPFLDGYLGLIRAAMPPEVTLRIPEVPDGPPIRAWCSFTSGATASEMQMRLDLQGLIELGAALTRR